MTFSIPILQCPQNRGKRASSRGDFSADFNTGAYASWGPTVANRVPVHAGGPYRYSTYRARSRAVYTNTVPGGAFRGFGVPQSAVAQESLFDELAEAVVSNEILPQLVYSLSEQNVSIGSNRVARLFLKSIRLLPSSLMMNNGKI